MEDLKNKQICECGEKSVIEAQKIFEQTDLPYKKAKKLVTGCDKTCCRKALMELFNMTYYGEIDMKKINDLINF